MKNGVIRVKDEREFKKVVFDEKSWLCVVELQNEVERALVIEDIKSALDRGDKTALWLLAKLDERRGFAEYYQKYNSELAKLAVGGDPVFLYVVGDCLRVEELGFAKDEAGALVNYEKSAKKGYIPAMNEVAWYYLNGKNNEKNPKKAFKLYKEGAKYGEMNAQYGLGHCYYWGEGVKVDYDKAFELFSLSAKQGLPRALNHLGMCYEFGRGVDIDVNKAVEYYQKGANLSDSGSYSNLARCYENGYGVRKNKSKATTFKKKSKELRDFFEKNPFLLRGVYGEFASKTFEEVLGCEFDGYEADLPAHLPNRVREEKVIKNDKKEVKNSKNSEKNANKTIKNNEKSTQATKNVVEAKTAQNEEKIVKNAVKSIKNVEIKQEIKSNMDYKALGKRGIESFKKNKYAEAFKNLKIASEYCADADIMYYLSLCYSNGYGCESNSKTAAECLYKALCLGSLDAKATYGEVMIREGNAEQIKEGEQFLIEVASKGLVRAQKKLADSYYFGERLPIDYEKAGYWFKILANNGDSMAQFNLGVMASQGIGMPINYEEAVRWYRRASNNGHVAATFELGRCYFEASGVSRDVGMSLMLVEKAAKAGYEDAQRTLEDLYRRGDCVKKDLAKANYWLREAEKTAFEKALKKKK